MKFSSPANLLQYFWLDNIYFYSFWAEYDPRIHSETLMMGVENTQTIQSELASSLLYSCSRSARSRLSLVRHRIQDKEVLLQSFYSSMFWIQLRIKRYFQFFVNHISKLSLPDFLLLAGSETKKWFPNPSLPLLEREQRVFFS